MMSSAAFKNERRVAGFLIALIAYVLSGCTAEPPSPQPRKLASANFTIVTESPFDAKAILIDLEQLRVAALQDWGIIDPPNEPTPIILTFIKDEAIYFSIAPLSQAAGYYSNSMIGDNIVIFDQEVFSNSDLPETGLNHLREITRHEAIHALMRRHVPASLPLWAAEGLAEYYANYERSDDGTVRFGALRKVGDPDLWPPMDVVLSAYRRYPEFRTNGSDGPTIAENARQFYGVSHGLAHLLLEHQNGIHAVHNWHSVIASGWSLQDAATGLLSPMDTDVWARLREKIDANEPTLRVADNVPLVKIGEISHTDLSESEYAAHLRRLVRMHRPLEHGQRAPVYRRLVQAHSTAADYALAQAYEAYNSEQYGDAQTYLKRSLERDGADPAALLLQAVLALEDLSRYDGHPDYLSRAGYSFQAAEAASNNLSFLYAFRLHMRSQIPYAITPSENFERYLDGLQRQNVHSHHAYLGEILIDPFLEAGRRNYARQLFFSAFHLRPSLYGKRNLWRRYARHFDLGQEDWTRAGMRGPEPWE